MRNIYMISALALGISAASADERAVKRDVSASAFTITDAIKQAVQTHPGVTEAAANRRATEAEMRQTQATLLPQVRLQGSWGPEKQTRYDTIAPPASNGHWRNTSREASIVVRQLLFDGLATVNDVWRQSARVDAAAARVHERTELIALDAVEAYIDVVRYNRLIVLAEENVRAHTRIAGDVRRRFEGGRSGEGDNEQARERLAGTRAVLDEFRLRLEDARAKYRRAVGLEPINVRFPGRLAGLPPTKDDSLAIALRHNPTLRAAGADAEAAKFGFRATAGSFVPTVSLEGRATQAYDTQDIDGKRDELSGKVVMSWDVFRSGQDMWRRSEMADRMIEQTQRHARLQRDAFESLDKAWGARTITNDRIRDLLEQAESARRVIGSYTKEYDLGQRTLIDLLDAYNQHFNALVSLVSARAVAVFADYQLLAAMGHLLDYVKTAPPIEADPFLEKPIAGILPYRLPPILIGDPSIAPKPLNVQGAGSAAALGFMPGLIAPVVVNSAYPNWTSIFDLQSSDPVNAPGPGFAKPGQAEVKLGMGIGRPN